MTTNEDQPVGSLLTQAQIGVLYTRGIIDRTTWTRALRALRGSPHAEGQHALQTCAVAIEALVERAVDAACAAIQERLGVKTGDLAATVLSDGTIERELTRYVHAELANAGEGEAEAEPAALAEPAKPAALADPADPAAPADPVLDVPADDPVPA